MSEEEFELLITVVVGADGEEDAQGACQNLLRQVGGQVVESRDCSNEEPGCWSVMIRRSGGVSARPDDASGLARAVRAFVRELGPQVDAPRISCEPPAAWTVLDDPELVGALVPGGERLLVEAWSGANPHLVHHAPPVPTPAPVATEVDKAVANKRVSTALWLRVDVIADRVTAAAWQAQALAGHIARSATVAGTVEHDGLQRVHLDLGVSAQPPAQAVLAGAIALGGAGWSPVEHIGDVAVIRWVAEPRPISGITALELAAGPTGERVGKDIPPPSGASTAPA